MPTEERRDVVAPRADIAERKEQRLLEEELRESEARYRNLVENTMDWIWEMGLDGKHTCSNHQLEKILGYSADEFTALYLDQLIHPQDMKEVDGRLPSLIAEKRGWKGWVVRFRHKDGSYRYLESNAHPILDAAGAVCGFRGVDRDITERKEAEENLRKIERRLNSAQRDAKIGNWERDLATKEGWWSDETYRLFGVTPQEQSLTHEAFLERAHPDDRQRVTKGAGSRNKALLMAFKLLDMAQLRWRRLDGSELLPLVRAGVTFVDGVRQERAEKKAEGKQQAA